MLLIRVFVQEISNLTFRLIMLIICQYNVKYNFINAFIY